MVNPPQLPDIWTISQLTRHVKNLLELEVGRIWVAGEISNWRVSPTGHAYFTLKDTNSQLDGVMFRGRLGRLAFEPESGLEVIVHGQITVYERRGNYQIVCEEMHPKGLGALQLAFEKLKQKLDQEGLFAQEHKKQLPLLPRRIGIVTSPSGAAIRDILNVINRRFANLHLLLYPARVQGEGAAAEIIEGIQILDQFGVDVMIVGRGGGSLEDLWSFNEEAVVRAIYAAQTPIISAVGHEIDFTLSDFAADLRASTPSAAAEIVVQEQAALLNQVKQLRHSLARGQQQHIARAQNRLRLAQGAYIFRRPEELIRQRRQQLDELRMRMDATLVERLREGRQRLQQARRSLGYLSPSVRLQRAHERLVTMIQKLPQSGRMAIERNRSRLGPLIAQLNALSPLGVLARGYALVWKEPEHVLVRDAGELALEDTLLLKFGHGGATAVVTEIEEPDNG